MQLLAKPPATFQQHIWLENVDDSTSEKCHWSVSKS